MCYIRPYAKEAARKDTPARSSREHAREFPLPNAMSSRLRQPHTRFAVRMVLVFAVLVVVMVVVAVQVFRTAGDFITANEAVAHTWQVKQQLTATVLALRTAEASQRAYLLARDPARLADAYGALPQMAERGARLQDLVADNDGQQDDVRLLRELIQQRNEGMLQLLAAFEVGGIEAVRAHPLSATARQQDSGIDRLVARMAQREDAMLAARQQASLDHARLTRSMTLAAMVLCILVLAIALFLILRELARRARADARVGAAHDDLARSLDESRRLGDTLNQLSELGHLLQGCRTLEEAAGGLKLLLLRLFPGSSGAIYLQNASQNLLTPTLEWGDIGSAEAVFAPDDCWAVRLGHAYPDDEAANAFTCRHLATVVVPGSPSHVCVPLFAQGGMLGILLLFAPAISAETRSTAMAAAEQVSLAIANLRLQDTLRTQSLRDPLTGLFNRRYLEASLARDLARALRRSQPLAVLMLDIDHFKRFNDEFGHDGGDALLSQVGEVLASLVRNEDVACRYGGEEFTLVIQEADAAMALDRAEEIRKAIAMLHLERGHKALGQVTASIGIASYPQHGDTPEQLLKRADRALYTAKHNGRNQVWVADRI